jgi:hypothetical protein
LNSTSDQIEYRVWDYPIKEQYGHILQAITQVGPVNTTEEGFMKVKQDNNKILDNIGNVRIADYFILMSYVFSYNKNYFMQMHNCEIYFR